MSERLDSNEKKSFESSLWGKAENLLDTRGQELKFPPGRGFGQDIDLEVVPNPMRLKPASEDVRLVVFERFPHKTNREVGHLFWKRTETTSFEHRITMSLRARINQETHEVLSLVLEKGEKPIFHQFTEKSVPSGDPFQAKLPIDWESTEATTENLEMFDRILELVAKQEANGQYQ